MKQNEFRHTLELTGSDLTLEDVFDVANGLSPVNIADSALARMAESFALVEKIAKSGKPTYGISTGFGELSRIFISEGQNVELQLNLIRSHASGVGRAFSKDTVRAIMLLRLNALCVGYSGINPEVACLLAELINYDITPVIPEQGSLGASGDLANLAHMSLVLLGEGEAMVDGERMSGEQALRACGLFPVRLRGKDGLALINGTSVMLGVGTLACLEAENCLKAANASAALTFEALRGFRDAYDPRIHELRDQLGQKSVAQTLIALLEGSEYADSRQEDVQDAYSLRCVPQVHGASDDALAFVRSILTRELNAVTDNPIVFVETGEVISGGNFHGQPLALSLDFLAIAVAELANISERRTERMVNPQLSCGLPAFLCHDSGVQSGFMISQYVAAALVSENKILAHPASVDSIPSSANKEDHVSMGAIAARKARMVSENTSRVIAIELMCAAQAIDLMPRRRLGAGTEKVHRFIREHVLPLTVDRPPSPDIETLAKLVLDGSIANCFS
ncbi:MAG: histidine ammonia-lyase [Clostridiaceae bacterium]|nr:histidine ammonia-lyase [Clostridiaceae bacterium]